MAKTIFKKIIDREIPAEILYEDDLCLAFRDIDAKAPTHVLMIPKKEIPSLAALSSEDHKVMGHLVIKLAELAKTLGLNDGYRVVVNCGSGAGQTVDHLHFHLLGGRPLKWPPG